MKRMLIPFITLIIITSSVYAETFDSLKEKGDTFYKAGDFKQAERIFTRAILAFPDKAKGYTYRGDAFFQRKMYVEAEKDYTKSIELDSSNPRVYFQRGNCFYNREIYPEALKDYSKALELDDSNGLYWLYRGNCYRKMDMKDKAIEDYTEAERIGNKDARGYITELNVAKTTGGSAISNNVKVEPFTGAVFRTKGITFTDVEISPEKDNAYIVGNDIPLKFSLVVKIMKPGGFAKDKDGNVFLGAGFGVYEPDGRELGKADDIYKDSTEGIAGMYLSSLSMTVTFSKPMENGKEYVLKMWFFDKKGFGRVDVWMPFRVSVSPSLSRSILKTDSVLGPGIRSAAVNASVESVRLMDKDSSIPFDAISPEMSYNVLLMKMKNCEVEFYTAEFISDNGTVVKAGEGKLSPSENIICEISTNGLEKKVYHLRVRIQGKTGDSIYCIVIPVMIK